MWAIVRGCHAGVTLHRRVCIGTDPNSIRCLATSFSSGKETSSSVNGGGYSPIRSPFFRFTDIDEVLLAQLSTRSAGAASAPNYPDGCSTEHPLSSLATELIFFVQMHFHHSPAVRPPVEVIKAIEGNPVEAPIRAVRHSMKKGLSKRVKPPSLMHTVAGQAWILGNLRAHIIPRLQTKTNLDAILCGGTAAKLGLTTTNKIVVVREPTDRATRRKGQSELLQVVVEHIGATEDAYVLAVDHWDLSAWTTRCPTAALLSVFDDVAADAPSKGDSAALARAATPVGGDTASACAPHKPSAGALEDAPRNTSASPAAGKRGRASGGTDKNIRGPSLRPRKSGGPEGLVPLVDLLTQLRSTGRDHPGIDMEVEISSDDDEDAMPTFFSFIGNTFGDKSTSKQKPEPAPGPERTLAQHNAMFADSDAAASSTWANTPATLSSSIHAFVHDCFAAIRDAPQMHSAAEEVVDGREITKGIVVLRGVDHTDYVSTFDAAVQAASEEYPDVRVAFLSHDLAPREITDVVRETEETSGSEGTFAPKSATSALGSCVELPEYSHPEFRAEVWPQSTCGETRGTTWTEHLTRCHMIRVQYHNHLMLGLTMIEFGLYCKDFHCLLKLPMAAEPVSAHTAVDMIRMAYSDFLVEHSAGSVRDTPSYLEWSNFAVVADALAESRVDASESEYTHPQMHVVGPHHLDSTDVSSTGLVQHERKLLGNLVSKNETGVGFDDVAALDYAKQKLHDLITLPLLRPKLFDEGILQQGCKGVLLFGPPGTGKTLLAKAVATEAKANFLYISQADIMALYYGEAQRYAKAVFTLARKKAPCVIFIDEVDSFFQSRDQMANTATDTDVMTEMMQEWDGLASGKGRNGVVVLGATNRPMDLDDAVLRRFPRRLLVDLPTEEGRRLILCKLLRENTLAADVDLVDVAKRTVRYSGSDLRDLCYESALTATKRFIDLHSEEGAANDNVLSVEIASQDFLNAIKVIKPSVDPQSKAIRDIIEWNARYGEVQNDRQRRFNSYGFEVPSVTAAQ